MKVIITLVFSLVLIFGSVQGQTTRTVGGTGASYATLKSAFDAINTGTIKGAIILQLSGNTTAAASPVLYKSGNNGTSSYTSLKIYPITASIAVSSSGNFAVIDLNGADNVTIDGRMNMTGIVNNLTIIGTNTGASAATVRFLNSAENNILKYCNIGGSTASSAMGIVLFGSANSGNGNDNNIIEYCNITNSGARPLNAIMSSGSSSRDNSGNTVRYNNIYNFLNPGNGSFGINIASNSTSWTVLENSFYETTEFKPAGTVSYNVIHVGSSTEHNISGNFIGGSAPQCGGAAWTINANYAHYFCGIYVYGGLTTATTVQNNIIKNISYTSTEDNPWDGIFLYSGNVNVTGNTIGATTGTNSITCTTPVAVATTTMSSGAVTAIHLVSGGSGYTTPPVVAFSTTTGTPATATAYITGGIVTSIVLNSGGSGYSAAPSVIFDGQSNNYSTSHGMINNSTGVVNITGNNIGSITTVGSDYYSHGFESIYIRNVAATTTLSNNLIGSLTTDNSIYTSSAAASSLIKQDVYGLYSASTLTTTISGNTVAHLTNGYAGLITSSRTRGIQTIAGTNTIQNNTVRDLNTTSRQSTGGVTSSVIGISQIAAVDGTVQIITGNTVYNLSNSNAAARTYVSGIYYAGPGTGNDAISGNFIHSLSVSSSDLTSNIIGIDLNSGMFTCANNIVNLGAAITGNYVINGIWDESTGTLTRNIYYNAVYIGGTVTSASTVTCALRSETSSETRDYRNNILFNARSGGTGKHYAIYLKNAGTTGLTCNYNDYWVSPSTNGVMGYVGTDKVNLVQLQSATGGDQQSDNLNPGFAIAGGTSAINYYPSTTLQGVSISGLNTDYFDITRGTPPKMGAIEANANVWQGGISSDFATAGNWTTGTVPSSGADIIFATSPVNDCFLDGNRTIGNITNGSTNNLVVNGKNLTITRNLNFTNTGKVITSAASSVVELAGTSIQVLPSAVFESNTVKSLIVNNSSGVTLNGNLMITQGLALTSGTLVVGPYTLTISGSSPTSGGGTINAGNTSAEVVFANATAIVLPSTFFTGIINNLTISGPGGVTAGSNISVNGVLNLAAANPSATKGLLEMTRNYGTYPGTTITDYLDSYVLNMGASATTTGTGDVTGTVKRSTISANTPYTFGHQFTTISLTTGIMPSSLSVTITIGATPGNTTPTNDIIREAINRTYEIVPADGSGSFVTANFHYLDTEMTSNLSTPPHTNTELKLTTMDYDIDAGGHGALYSDEHGRANYDYINNFIGLSSVPISYFIQIAGTHEWRTIFTLRDYGVSYITWNGSQHTTNWKDLLNWTISDGGAGVPNNLSHVIIPDAATVPDNPSLPSGNTTINTLSIENGGILTMGNNTLTIENFFSGGWEDQNPSGNDPGTSTVIFTRPNTTISGNARFYNVQIAAIDAVADTIADITNQTGSTMKIGGSIARTGLGTGKWYADVFGATVEYNGETQTVLLPDGSPDYHNLVLSGSGTKTFPASPLSIHGDLTLTGTVLAIAGGAITTQGTFSIGPGASFTAGSYSHSIGDFVIFSDATGTGSLITNSPFSGTVERYIPGDFKWHFLSSPIASQPIWPAFAPVPSDIPLTFGAPPWGWDFYYWNPNANTATQLYWVNLRQDNIGTYNSWPVDLPGSSAGFGAATPVFTEGRGYLAAYSSGYPGSATHNFSGNLNYGNKTIAITKSDVASNNPWNLAGNPYPSSIDWEAGTGWTKTVLEDNGSDYWIFNDTEGNYGVYNSTTHSGTHSTSRNIAPMQAFFVKAASAGELSMTSAVQVHSNQTWLKEGPCADNSLRLKLTTSSNNYSDEMIVAVNPVYDNGGSSKFWSMYNEAPELFSIKGGSNYSIERMSSVDENSVVAIGIKAGLDATYTLSASGPDNFFFAKSLLLEDLKTGNTQELKNNPTYTFSANPGDAPERFHLHFGGPFGIDTHGARPEFTISSFNNTVNIMNTSGRDLEGTVSICNILGQAILHQKITEQANIIRLNAPAGWYIVSLVTNNQSYSKKIFIH